MNRDMSSPKLAKAEQSEMPSYRCKKKSPCPFSWGLFFFQNSDSRSSSSNLKEKKEVWK